MEEKKSRIIIRDLPEDEKIGREEMKRVLGGAIRAGFKQPEPDDPISSWPYPWPKPPWPIYW